VLYKTPELYDTLLPVSADQLTFYETLAKRQRGAVLALASGTGQLIVPVASTDLRACGLDSSPEMIMVARRRAAAARTPSALEAHLTALEDFSLLLGHYITHQQCKDFLGLDSSQ
jgi:SAM-dependent methyltransferase